jgi:hypothetical protein
MDRASGVDFMRTKVRLSVQGVVNPASMSYSGATAGPTPGVRASLTLPVIRQQLLTPRRLLQVYIGADLVFMVFSINQQENAPYTADPGNGPIPHRGVTVSEGNIIGDRTIIVTFGVDFWVAGLSNIVLSNRWSTTHSVNRNGMTTRTLHGRAVVRADAIASGAINNADDFRAALIVVQPKNFRRESVVCTCSEDGTELSYTVVDKETGNSLGGPGNPINVFHIEGNASAGFDLPFKTYQEAYDTFTSGASDIAAKTVSGNILGAIKTALHSFVPRLRGWAMCRVEGGRNVPRELLAKLAGLVCLDRAQGGIITSMFFTQSLNADEGQSCECRMEWMPAITVNAGEPNGTDFAGQVLTTIGGQLTPQLYMRMDNDYLRKNLALNPPLNIAYMNTGRRDNNLLPNGYGTRGAYVQRMAQQALTPPSGTPPNPPTVDGDASRVHDIPNIS